MRFSIWEGQWSRRDRLAVHLAMFGTNFFKRTNSEVEHLDNNYFAMKRSSISKKSLEPDKKSRNAFLLITLYRSGSTLTGELFNRNPNFLYYFEPLGKILKFPIESERPLSKVHGHWKRRSGKVSELVQSNIWRWWANKHGSKSENVEW